MEEGELAFAPVRRSVTKKCDMMYNFILNTNSLPALSSRNRGRRRRRFLRPNHPSPHEAPSGPICMEGQEEEEEESVE